MDYTVIKFDIKAPSDVFESELNTIVLALHQLRNMNEEHKNYNSFLETEAYNKNINIIKNSLDSIQHDIEK